MSITDDLKTLNEFDLNFEIRIHDHKLVVNFYPTLYLDYIGNHALTINIITNLEYRKLDNFTLNYAKTQICKRIQSLIYERHATFFHGDPSFNFVVISLDIVF